MEKILAFIPARKNSKRLPNKNIKILNGKPMIAWTIEAALKSKFDMTVHVSTDSKKIAAISEAYGAQVPFLRSPNLARDESDQFEALLECIHSYKEVGVEFEYIINLQPTSPLRTADDIDQSINLFKKYTKFGCKSVISISQNSYPSEWIFQLNDKSLMNEFVQLRKSSFQKRSQDFNQSFYLNGSIYLARVADVLLHKSFYIPEGDTIPVMIPKSRSVDIDDEVDFLLAEFWMKHNEL
jgi:CMP-N,N'-diacetyllegionaminic acid synthase